MCGGVSKMHASVFHSLRSFQLEFGRLLDLRSELRPDLEQHRVALLESVQLLARAHPPRNVGERLCAAQLFFENWLGFNSEKAALRVPKSMKSQRWDCAWPSSQKQEKSATVGWSPMSQADSPSHLSIVFSVAGLIGEGARPRSGRMAGAKEEMVISRVLRWCQLKYSCQRPAAQSAESSGAEGAAQAGAEVSAPGSSPGS